MILGGCTLKPGETVMFSIELHCNSALVDPLWVQARVYNSSLILLNAIGHARQGKLSCSPGHGMTSRQKKMNISDANKIGCWFSPVLQY